VFLRSPASSPSEVDSSGVAHFDSGAVSLGVVDNKCVLEGTVALPDGVVSSLRGVSLILPLVAV